MRKFCAFVLLTVIACGVQASWYWPFESDSGGETPKRISDLMEPASLLIDEATDLATDGKVDESVGKYRAALAELDRIEMENPDRASTPEFATLRNKRAYVNAAIDSMLLSQVKANAKAVAVSDTTELEKKLAAEKKTREEAQKPVLPATREQAMAAIAKGDYAAAEEQIDGLLKRKPDSAAYLNLKAVLEVKRGNFAAAQATLEKAIKVQPRSHYAYYNLADLLLRTNPGDKSVAKVYYEAGREAGGPVNARLEEALK